MAKSKTAALTARRQFDGIATDLVSCHASLACAVQALEASDAVEKCEIASRASIVLHNAVADLDELHNRLGRWELDHGQGRMRA